MREMHCIPMQTNGRIWGDLTKRKKCRARHFFRLLLKPLSRQKAWSRPEVLLAAKTYANDPLKPALTVGFCTFEG